MVSVYVGNLPFSATEEEVAALFSPFGEVRSVNLIVDRDTGRPRGFGFVELDAAAAEAAIENLNGHPMQGRPLRVNAARKGARRSPFGAR